MLLNPAKMESELKHILEDAVDRGEETACQLTVFQNGELLADLAVGEGITRDSLFPIFSVGKGIASTAFHQVFERGLIDYDARVADYWPEFGCNGKENIRVWHILSHRSGMQCLPPSVNTDWVNWRVMCDKLAAAAPANEPGVLCNYQAVTFAWLVGELAARASGVPFDRWIKEHVIAPLGLEKQLYFGSDAEAESRFVKLDASAVRDKQPWTIQFMHDPIVRHGFIPSANGMANSYALARHYAGLLSGELLKRETLDNATFIRRHESDPVLPDQWYRFGLGYVCCGPDSAPGQVFGHGGAAGAEGWADKKTGLAVGFTKNKLNEHHPDHPVRERIARTLGIEKFSRW